MRHSSFHGKYTQRLRATLELSGREILRKQGQTEITEKTWRSPTIFDDYEELFAYLLTLKKKRPD